MKKGSSISLADLGVAAIGSSSPLTTSPPSASPAQTSLFFGFGGAASSLSWNEGSPSALFAAPPLSSKVNPGSGDFGPLTFYMTSALVPTSPSKEVPSSTVPLAPPSFPEGSNLLERVNIAPPGSVSTMKPATSVRNYANVTKNSAQLQELGTPSEHVSGVPFVLIPDENFEAAKLEFKDFIYARFHGDYPSMGKVIGVVNAIWAKAGPRIFVHNIGKGMYLLRVTNPRAREHLLSRTCWNIGGLPMFVAPWAPDFSPDEPLLTSAIVPVEMRNVPYLLFNNESLSRIATAIGIPDSVAPETERKENFEVAKLFVRVDLTTQLPHKIVSGFSNGKEVVIDVTYPWLPVKCDACKKYGHKMDSCSAVAAVPPHGENNVTNSRPETSRKRSKSRPGRSRFNPSKNAAPRYSPVKRATDADGSQAVSDAALPVAAGDNERSSETATDAAVTSNSSQEGDVKTLVENTQVSVDKAKEVLLEEGEIPQANEDSPDIELDTEHVMVQLAGDPAKKTAAGDVSEAESAQVVSEAVSGVVSEATSGVFSESATGVVSEPARVDSESARVVSEAATRVVSEAATGIGSEATTRVVSESARVVLESARVVAEAAAGVASEAAIGVVSEAEFVASDVVTNDVAADSKVTTAVSEDTTFASVDTNSSLLTGRLLIIKSLPVLMMSRIGITLSTWLKTGRLAVGPINTNINYEFFCMECSRPK
ncbi:hypothetical protein Rs2_05675 [Raphanus sativus]|nr:hypothetical protein Rs2_05675 [Raphanus sativus]